VIIALKNSLPQKAQKLLTSAQNSAANVMELH